MEWQFYWQSWGLSYSKYPYGEEDLFGELYTNYLIIGPLQIRWFSNA